MVLAQDGTELLDDSATVDNQACLSAWAPAQQPVYADAGPLAPDGPQGAAAQELRSVTAKPLQNSVVQAAVAMQSQLAAIGFVQIQQKKWHTCAGTAITVTPAGEGAQTWEFAQPVTSGGAVSIGAKLRGGEASCQHGMAAAGNVVIEIRQCPPQGGNDVAALVRPPPTRFRANDRFRSVTGGLIVRSRSLARAAGFLLVATVAPSCATEGAPVAETTPASATSAASAPATTNAPSPTPKSDEDQIRDTVMAFQDAFNTQNWDAYLNLMCRAMREQFTAPVMERLKTTRTDQGLTQVISVKATIAGDNATATLDAQNELLGRQTVDLPLVREDGWKICKVALAWIHRRVVAGLAT